VFLLNCWLSNLEIIRTEGRITHIRESNILIWCVEINVGAVCCSSIIKLDEVGEVALMRMRKLSCFSFC